MTERNDNVRRYTRRGVLGASAALGIAAVGGAEALAATAGGEARPDHRAVPRPGAELASGEAVARADVADARAAEDLWGFSSSGEGAGVRGTGLQGVLGEGTHTGVAGDGFIGVRGITSSIRGDETGVGVWAQADTPGSLALRADGPAQFNGVTAFARSGAVTVRSGSRSVTTTGVELAPGSVILATLQKRVDNVYVHAVETDPAAGSFTIWMTRAPDVDVPIGWLAIG